MAQPAPGIEIRRARHPAEREDALILRHAVFCEEQRVPVTLEMDGRDGEAVHLVAVQDGRVLGTCRLLIDGSTAKLGRLAVDAAARRQGVGTGLVEAAEAEARKAGAARMALNAQTRATSLYGGRGFTIRGVPFQEAGIEHVRMEKDLA